MPRLQTDDSIYDDPAVVRVGTAAYGLYSRCAAYIARHLTDGLVPFEVAAGFGTPEWISKLLDAGLWKRAPGGYYMPRYLSEDKNPTRDRVLADRKARSERQQRWLDKHHPGRRVNNASIDTSITPSIDASIDAAHPPSLKGRKGTPARARSAGSRPPPPLPPGQHEHPYLPGGAGGTCQVCELPKGNRRHPVEAAS